MKPMITVAMMILLASTAWGFRGFKEGGGDSSIVFTCSSPKTDAIQIEIVGEETPMGVATKVYSLKQLAFMDFGSFNSQKMNYRGQMFDIQSTDQGSFFIAKTTTPLFTQGSELRLNCFVENN